MITEAPSTSGPDALEFTRLFRQLDDVSHVDALEVLSVWEARANGGSARAQRRVKACEDVLGIQERRIYR